MPENDNNDTAENQEEEGSQDQYYTINPNEFWNLQPNSDFFNRNTTDSFFARSRGNISVTIQGSQDSNVTMTFNVGEGVETVDLSEKLDSLKYKEVKDLLQQQNDKIYEKHVIAMINKVLETAKFEDPKYTQAKNYFQKCKLKI